MKRSVLIISFVVAVLGGDHIADGVSEDSMLVNGDNIVYDSKSCTMQRKGSDIPINPIAVSKTIEQHHRIIRPGQPPPPDPMIPCSICGRESPLSYLKKHDLRCPMCENKYKGKSNDEARLIEASNTTPQTVLKTKTNCDICFGPLVQESYTVGADKNIYIINTPYGIRTACARCKKAIKEHDHICFVCKRRADYQCEPGIYLCETCKSKRMTPAKVDAMIPRIVSEIEGLLKQSIPCTPTYIPCTYAEMQKDKDGTAIEYGLYTCETTDHYDQKTGKVYREEQCTIRFVRHVPDDVFQDVIAHEIAHHWLHHCVRVERSLKDEEGFSEWVAYHISKMHKLDRLVRGHTENTDPVYGDGFREIKKKIESGRYKTPEALFVQ